ncbi:hypothetical protein KRR38_02325 [Novosphingobium sp. G106]|uniref:hypothetical protein n=1 Tax=Novosphingobium sp. G106 TaxID=2849500 RepID=UPI001C2DAAAF|nr:hypothetical protein [Novosphingobium sp. G106]MBV1686532.1 hypothetical protein [Novosphingobium sp. G106]
MKTIAYLAAGCAAMLAMPAFAQSTPYSPRYESRTTGGSPDIERQIQSLDDAIYSADRQRRISPSQADAYIRELRDIETQLLDVRERTFSGRSDDSDRQPSPAPSYREPDPYPSQDDQRDSREPPAAPASRDSSDWNSEHS